MALSTIDDILADFPGWTTEFKLVSYDETSKTQGGDTLVKARGTPLWNLTATSRTLRANELDYWRARLESLDAGKRPFWGYSLSRCWPIAYPKGEWQTDILTAAPFSRSSTATYWGSDGLLHTAATNVLRDAYDPVSHAYLGKMVEGTDAENYITNNTMVGSTAGTPGTLPTDWIAAPNGLTQEIVGIGTEDGIDYIDIRLSGTATEIWASVTFPGGTGVFDGGAVATVSAYVRMVAGSLVNAGDILLANRALLTPSGYFDQYVSLNEGLASPLKSSRFQIANTPEGTLTGDGGAFLMLNNMSGPIDITLRIGLPQMEQGSFATSPIRTTAGVFYRTADVLALPDTMIEWNADALTVEFVGQALPGWSFIDFGQFDRGSLNQPGAFRFHVQADRAMFYVQYPDGTDTSVSAYATIDLTQPVTAKFSWNGTTIGVSVNGSPVQTATMSVPASDFGFTRFILGAGSWFTQAGAIIESVTMTPEPMITGNATIASLGSNNKSLSLTGLPPGFTLAVGDMLSFEYTSQPRYALHRVQEAATAGSDGTTGTFEVRPFIQPGATVGSVVRIKQPRCLMMLVPGSITSTAQLQNGMGTVSFQGVQIPREF